MTVCIAVKQGRKVYVGADSISISPDGEFDLHGESKVWTHGPWVLASSGSHRAAQIIKAECPLVRRVPKDPMYYLVQTWTKEVRRALHAAGYVADTKSSDCPIEGNIIIACPGHIFEVQGDLSVTETRRDHTAIGSGAPWAMGSLHATRDLPGKKRLVEALSAAEANTVNVRGPFTMEIAA